MATLLWKEKEFRVSGLEMIKGVRWGGVESAMTYLDELVVPIIENTPEEEDLRHTMAEVSIPSSCAPSAYDFKPLIGHEGISKGGGDSGTTAWCLCMGYVASRYA
jgi:hypothetical protein